MQYYAIQVMSGREDRFIEMGNALLDTEGSKFFTPKRELQTKKNGVKKRRLYPVFTGYVFLETNEISIKMCNDLKRIKYFSKILPNTKSPRSLTENDLVYIKHFLNFGNVARISKATFNENNRIVILEGALKGLEGKIIKVDKRKGRAKVQLDMYKDSFSIDFGFEVIQSIDKN
ncbi:MAG: transcriptional antiterminator NusG [Treponema sp.]|nr:MAG: transcriptional antiterminator NusG [Treponema sp.]